MSTIKNFFNDLRKLLTVGGTFLGVGFLDVLVFTDATSIPEMTWWGQTSVFGFLSMLAAMVIRFGILPISGWIFSLFKKKK